MDVDVTEIAKRVKEFAEKHAYTFTADEKKYVPLEVWQYAARLQGWSIRIKEVTKNGGDFQATAEAVDKGSVVGSGIGCVTADETTIKSTYERMKIAQARAVSCMLTNTLSDVMKMAGFATTPLEDAPALPEVYATLPKKDAEQIAVPKKPLEHFTAIVDEYTDKLSLMIDKLSILSDAKKEGLTGEDFEKLVTKIDEKYSGLE